MHDIEPYHRWRDHYEAEKDDRSPFFGREYDEFRFTQKIYNYFIHPQWDEFGSSTLYMKILFVDYDKGFAAIELIGEWNDCLQNDVMFLKREIIDHLAQHDISKFILLCDNVLNFHGSDDCYYEEWHEDAIDEKGWIVFINLMNHVEEEMQATNIHQYVHFGGPYNDINWRSLTPKGLYKVVNSMIHHEVKRISN